MIPVSILDLAPIVEGGSAAQSLRNSLELAQQAERWGYHRYWVAEHHNMPGIASSATAVLIGYLAGATSRMRIGSGGIMLPNHSPLVVAEQFGTLDTLYPGRIDLGLGRAPGTDPLTARALRRERLMAAEQFPQDVLELQSYLGPPTPEKAVHAIPGEGSNVPLWLLGSSDFSARLAASLGLPFAFASHFAPAHLQEALELYRTHFQPSAQLDHPYVMAGLTVVAADTDEEATLLYTSLQQRFLAMRKGVVGALPPPVASMDALWTAEEKAEVDRALRCSAVGAPETVRRGVARFVEETAVDEVMVSAHIFDHAARLRSYELLAEAVIAR